MNVHIEACDIVNGSFVEGRATVVGGKVVAKDFIYMEACLDGLAIRVEDDRIVIAEQIIHPTQQQMQAIKRQIMAGIDNQFILNLAEEQGQT